MTEFTLSRRAALTGVTMAGLLPSESARSSPDDHSLERSPSMKSSANGRPLFGLTAPAARISSESYYCARMAEEMGLYTLESDFQWSSMETRPGEWNFQRADEGVRFAKAHGVRVAGHALYYHHFIPLWLASSADADALTHALEARIKTTVARYQGAIQRWDVVNEPLNARDGLPGGLRASSYSRTLGEHFIDAAFHVARASDPSALLGLNEAEFEYADQQGKRDDLLALLRRLKERGAPVDVLGIQAHLTASKAFDFNALEAFLNQVRALGLKVAVTELDVIDVSLPADPVIRDRMVADHVRGFLRVIRNTSDLVSVTCWGYTDRYTWLDMWHKRTDGRPMRPLPFDFDLMRKPLWGAVQEIITT